ncbi:MAG: DUF3990 domain-containing protein [Lachnospiraceae bacterium]|nr:DUF3990 domain-containing protein [Lachnospiraceae bacterium]
MILYHGSRVIVETPVYGAGSEHNDYGRGFYCTEDVDLAKEWSCPVASDGFVNQYDLDMNGLRILNLGKEPYHILNWIAILLKNRVFLKTTPLAIKAYQYIVETFLPDTTNYDVIRGYRADDSYFAYAKDFLSNAISVGQLRQAMTLGELGEQIVLISPKAFSQIHFQKCIIADGSFYHGARQRREVRARNAYLDNHGLAFQLENEDLYVRDILNQGVKNDDPRLR